MQSFIAETRRSGENALAGVGYIFDLRANLTGPGVETSLDAARKSAYATETSLGPCLDYVKSGGSVAAHLIGFIFDLQANLTLPGVETSLDAARKSAYATETNLGPCLDHVKSAG